MNEPTTNWNQGDHDLLIELRTIMGAVREDIHSLKNIVQTNSSDHEVRLRSLEQGRWMVIGGAAVVATIMAWLTNALGNGLHL